VTVEQAHDALVLGLGVEETAPEESSLDVPEERPSSEPLEEESSLEDDES
jgi:hypothetical protein